VPPPQRPALHSTLDPVVADWLAGADGFERLDGVEMLEVRPTRLRKSLAVDWLRSPLEGRSRLLALGDDLTDEDLFAALGPDDEAVLVGPPRRSAAGWRLPDPPAVAALLDWIAATRRGEASGVPRLPAPLASPADGEPG
jgi:trehalose-6-phosphatase